MAYTLFISDVHLSPRHPNTTDHFNKFIQKDAYDADALYILGDFFDLWLGEDIDTAWSTAILKQLQSLIQAGTPVYFMHGNHDFLMSPTYLAQFGIQFLEDPTLIDLYGTKTVLLHGDSLCTLDKAYMRLRKILRNKALQALFLKLPQAWRHQFALALKSESQKSSSKKSMALMDVNPDAVEILFHQTGANRMIHGHTHLPALHPNRRLVMDAWHHAPSILMINDQGNETLLNSSHWET